MPKLSLTMETGSIVQWFKKEGERVEKGEPVVEVLSEKVTYDVEAPAGGILRRVLAEEGTDLPVGATLAFIALPEEELPEVEEAGTPAAEAVEETTGMRTAETSTVKERVLASPAAKRLAKERGVDLRQVKTIDSEGRITEEDVRSFVDRQSKPALRIKEEFPLSGIRKTTAERVASSFQTAPHSFIIMEANMAAALRLHEENGVSYTALLVFAVAKALREDAAMNSTLIDGRIRVYEDVNIGVAVSTEKGLVVPVVRDADKKQLSQISSELEELVEKARQGKLSKKQLTEGTFTVTNLGMYDVDVFLPIINPPEAAILATGRIVEKPVAANGDVSVKPLMTLTLAYDHRIVDGAPAAAFLRKIKKMLESMS
jgi:pyruvate dehydrogenase E2 component (dihydrolipoamide acetyltransferase)